MELDYDVRLASFFDWVVPDHMPDIEKMAEAGFVYAGNKQSVHEVYCSFCKISITNWKKHYIPLEEHQKYRPLCPFLKFKADSRVQFALKAGMKESKVLQAYKNYHLYDHTNEEFLKLVKKSRLEPKQTEDFMCQNCYKHYYNVLFLPCKHLAVCKKCSETTEFCEKCGCKAMLKIVIAE